MRDAIKSFLGFGWSMSLFGIRQALSLMTGRGREAVESLDAVGRAAAGTLSEPARSLHTAGERWMEKAFPEDGEEAGESPPPDPGRLTPSPFVVLGEGLAAGVGDFALGAEGQRRCFPAQMARQMGVPFPQVLLQSPGVGSLPGLEELPVMVPSGFQTTVAEPFPPPSPPANLAFPGLRLEDALTLRPEPPIVHRRDRRQTAANLILGLGALVRGEKGPHPTPLEAALERTPRLALVELGYWEAVTAAVAGDPALLPSPDQLGRHCRRLFEALRGAGAEVLALTVPDPTHTAGCSPLEAAARTVKVEAGVLAAGYGLDPGDHLTVRGLFTVGAQLQAGAREPLPAGCVLPAATAADLRRRLDELNAALTAVAREHGVGVYDLAGLFARLRREGILFGGRRLSADYLGGWYGLNGFYPGAAGHAVIAGELLELLNQGYGAHFPAPAPGPILAADPVIGHRPAAGASWGELPPLASPAADEPPARAGGATGATAAPAPWEGRDPHASPAPPHLTLPPDLEQVLPLTPEGSYHGDAIQVVDCRDPQEARWGSCGGRLFGGFCLFDSQLSGRLRIRFQPPVEEVTEFTVSLEGGRLAGDESLLAAPQLFRWPVRQVRVEEAPGFVSRGKLNLATGEVSDLAVHVRYLNSALFALARVNPHFPTQPISFPGQYGSAHARFEPRPDGKLDFTFEGRTFLPLGSELEGETVRWALPFAGPEGHFASIPARGLVLHPHLRLTTRVDRAPGSSGGPLLDLPANSLQELTFFSHNASFGDKFGLVIPELGGPATGRSHLAGRLLLQLGPRFGDSISAAISCLPPGGFLAGEGVSPLAEQFPGRLPPSPIGHDEFLRFPLRSYFLDAVHLIDDPFDVAVGAFDLRTGLSVGDLLHRGFIGQDLFYALVRVEPRIPRSSFFFQGPALVERGSDGRLVYRFKGQVYLPYQAGLKFPSPDLTTSYIAGEGSALDPYVWLRALSDGDGQESDPDPDFVMRGEARKVVASTGEVFSYSYSIPADPRRREPFFEYTNHGWPATFRLHTLAWVGFARSRHRDPRREGYDTVTLSGFGSWSKDSAGAPHLLTAQICISPDAPYVSIQVDGGEVSNVNTKPTEEREALP